MAAVAKIAEDPNISTHDKLHAHSLIVDCIEVKEELISDPTIIKEALRVVDDTKKLIVEIAPKSKELLHMEEEQEEVQPTQQQLQEEEVESEHQEDEDVIEEE